MTVGQKRRRLSRSAEFDRVYRHGQSSASRHLVVYAFPRSVEPGTTTTAVEGARLGVSVGRRVGGAVARNRVKRLLREAFWSLPEVPLDHDYVIVARAEAKGLAERDGLQGLQRDLAELLAELRPAKREDADA